MTNYADDNLGFMYFDTKSMESQERVALGITEIEHICGQLTLIIEKLSEIREEMRQADRLDHSLNWCAFLLEDFLYRKFNVRERLWDILGTTLQVSRNKIKNNEVFVERIKDELNTSNPALASAFIDLQNKINEDVKIRNISVHDTIIIPVTHSPPTSEPIQEDRPIEIQMEAVRQAVVNYTITEEQKLREFTHLCQNWIEEFKRE